MYWLNRVKKRIERAWMDGSHLDVNPFDNINNNYKFDQIVMTSGLTLDISSQSLFYICTIQYSLYSAETTSEIVMCKFYNRSSCHFIISSIKATDLVVNNVIFFTLNYYNY